MKQKKDFTEHEWRVLVQAVSDARLYLMKLLATQKQREQDQQQRSVSSAAGEQPGRLVPHHRGGMRSSQEEI